MITLFCNTSFSLPFDPVLLTLSLPELARLSAEEAQKYTQKRPNDSSIILALFYRACDLFSGIKIWFIPTLVLVAKSIGSIKPLPLA